MLLLILQSIFLGIVEGATEFLPVSSTGHLIVAGELVQFPVSARGSFEIFIQLGAILAVVWEFRRSLTATARGALAAPGMDRDLVGKVALAFLPAAAIGFVAGGAIQAYLFNTTTVGVALIAGGVVILVVERQSWAFRAVQVEQVAWRQALYIGLAQVLAMIPGVSRAGATIIGGVVVGLDRPTATQFSFYLAIPTMVAASSYSLLKALDELSRADIVPFAVGFVVSFVTAMFVVRAFLGYIRKHDFTVFGYYRILAGVAILLFTR